MKPLSARAVLVAAMFAFAACRSTPSGTGNEAATQVRFETLFHEAGHRLAWCQKEAADGLAQHPDGILFFDADSVLRIRVPNDHGQVPYHAHLFHRPASEIVDIAALQETDGTIGFDLARYPNPELLIVTSATVKMHVADPQLSDRTMPLLAPYAISFRLVPRGGP